MLNVSRIERGKMEFLFENVDVLSLVELTFEQLIPMSKDKKIDLLLNKPEKPLPQIMADKEKLRQVMNNLIDNAIKYTKQGSVLVEIFEEMGNIRFQVTDTGKGIGPNEKKAIFQKFSRGKESIIHSAGLGLGLYVAKVIIEQHKGKIWVESKGEGKGSTFIFTIPVKNDLKETTLLDLSQNNNTSTLQP
jgi:signal transduction histidine kinase